MVVAVEHLDGSAQMARYVDHHGKKKWLPYSFATTPGSEITVDDRASQLNLVGSFARLNHNHATSCFGFSMTLTDMRLLGSFERAGGNFWPYLTELE